MKLAVLADIHGNYVALERVTADIEAWQPDVVVVAGDVVNRGPRSWDCLQFVQRKIDKDGWLIVRGNHEEYVIGLANSPIVQVKPKYDFYGMVRAVYQQIGRDISPFELWPLELTLTAPNGGRICITHASQQSTRMGIFPEMSDETIRQLITPLVSLLCVGHTHRPLIRQIDQTLIINTGAVGLPFDGDKRASYARLTWSDGTWRPEIIRLKYDWAQAEQDMHTNGFLSETGPIARLVLYELRHAQSIMHGWTEAYQTDIMVGHITVEESVDRFLTDLNSK